MCDVNIKQKRIFFGKESRKKQEKTQFNGIKREPKEKKRMEKKEFLY